MAAGKKVKTSSAKKKSPSSVKGSKSPSKKKLPGQDRGRGPLYMLIILFLLTVIVFLINISYESFPLKMNKYSNDLFKEHGKGTVVIEKKDVEKLNLDPFAEKTAKEEEKGKTLEDEDKKITAEKSIDIKVYFLKLDEKTEELYLSPVRRKVSDKNIITLSLENLIAGPSAYEKAAGYLSAVPPGLKVNKAAVKGRSAEIDFSGVIEEDAPGQILIKRLQQIVYTATEFDGIDSIIITINGKRKKSIGADGLSISGPMSRN